MGLIKVLVVLLEEVAKHLLALQFPTRLPIPSSITFTEQRFADTPRYYPLIGLLVVLICALVFIAAIQIYSQPLAVAVMLGCSVLLTCAFHEDGLADTFGGIGGGQSREAALVIMKDSRLGTYGTLALGIVVLCKFMAMIRLPVLVAGLISGHALSRLSSVIVMATSRYVRDLGTGKPVSAGISRVSLMIATVTG